MDDRPLPHCDPRVLHAPGTCVYCDDRPDLQRGRIEMGMSFTGDPKPKPGAIMDAAVQERPLSVINFWPGNRASPPRRKRS